MSLTTTENTTPINTPFSFDKYMAVHQTPILFIAAISNIIIILVIIRNKALLHTRTNKLLLVWSLHDFLIDVFVSRLLRMQIDNGDNCVTLSLDVIVHHFQLFVIVCFLSNYLMEMKQLVVVGFVFFLLAVAAIGGYLVHCYNADDGYSLFLTVLNKTIFISIFFVLIGKEFYYYYLKRHERLHLTDDETFRINIIRIYIYQWTVCAIIYEFASNSTFLRYMFSELNFMIQIQLIQHFIYTLGYLAPMFMIIYAVSVNQLFREGWNDLKPCKGKKLDVEQVSL